MMVAAKAARAGERIARLLGVLLLLGSTAATATPLAAVGTPELSPPADDLSKLLVAATRAKTQKLNFEAIDNSMDAIERMLSAMPRHAGDPEILALGGSNEKVLLAANHKLVGRKGKLLQFRRPNGKFIQFRDAIPAGAIKRAATGDSFVYAGPLGNSGYHKIDAFSRYDTPGSFLLNPANGNAVFVHSATDLVSTSPDHKMLTVMNNGIASPFSILVTAFNPHGYEIDLHCQSRVEGGVRQRIIPFFTGWRRNSNPGFDLVLLVQRLDDDTTPRYEAVPVRFALREGEWHVLVPDPQRFTRSSKITCWQ